EESGQSACLMSVEAVVGRQDTDPHRQRDEIHHAGAVRDHQGGPSARALHGNAHLPSLFFRPRGTASREGRSCTTFPAGSRIRAPIPRLHAADAIFELERAPSDRKSTRLNSSHVKI